MHSFFYSEITSEKPNYEVGSSSKLSFAKKSNDKNAIAAIWKLDDGDDEQIDADDLLDEEDKMKPEPSSLRGEFIYFSIHSISFNAC